MVELGIFNGGSWFVAHFSEFTRTINSVILYLESFFKFYCTFIICPSILRTEAVLATNQRKHIVNIKLSYFKYVKQRKCRRN